MLEEVTQQDVLEIPIGLVSKVFTPRRVELLQTLRRRPFSSQVALARELGRAPSHVSVDLNYLEGIGLVDRSQGVRATDAVVVIDWRSAH